MAFQQPKIPIPARTIASPAPEQSLDYTRPSFPQAREEPQEWILFPQAESHRQTETASTDRTPKTAGLSRLSDFGSIESAFRSERERDLPCQATLGSEEDEKELDSLDDGLHAFREPHHLDQSNSIFPRHDGLGAFPDSSSDVQRQIWHFERYNPRKRLSVAHDRRPSIVKRKIDAIEASEAPVDDEKRERIEKWRLEHSRILLNEIEKETRRRRQSIAKSHTGAENSDTFADRQSGSRKVQQLRETVASQSIHEQRAPSNDNSESFLQNFTRRVIRDFVGIDEDVLSVIFGEALPAQIQEDLQPTFESTALVATSSNGNASWETRLLTRLARELGFLIDHLTEHPGAFSTLPPPSPPSSEYAGIPVTQPTSSRTRLSQSTHQRSIPPPASPSFNFKPSFPPSNLTPDFNAPAADIHKHASLWGIEEEPDSSPKSFDHDYWSRPANPSSLYRILQNHFWRPPSSTTPKPTKANLATTSTADTLRRTAVIRQYHPLVSRQWENRRRSFQSRGYAGSSTCGSQSLRRSKVRRGSDALSSTTSVASGGYSSRNFWDIGMGSPGRGGSEAGSLVGGPAGLGLWGEV
ncbi:uncharacterized protein KY384_002441 [Bacidia gigantensis]|uniref:uncharacterized protein n=1 Tax=Bacidia gigantensis TaxID=2732470 RepID=UPI001D04F1CE|nr:uncharacterized protein KY384_002441 [Bacidia gigantensis]KAG8532564.1 hypothetical protein KY384_002441 [Bacidia gigantensis]